MPALKPQDGNGGTLGMSPTQIIRSVGTALKGRVGLIGWIIILLRPALHLIDRFSEMDFVAAYWQAIRTFLDTGYGTLVSMAVGASIIGYSIVHAIHTAPSSSNRNASSSQASKPHDAQIANVTTTPSSVSAKAKTEISVAAMSDYDRGRRKREIDELIASITTGKTLQSLKDAGAFAWLLQSGICPRRSTQELADEIINVRNSLVNADNERLEIIRQFPENRDISDLMQCTDWPESEGASPRDLDPLLALHPYILQNLNIPADALNNLATWLFFKDTVIVAKLNAWLRGYGAWCDEVESALVEKRRVLGQ
jgi:hypothetical protein